MTTEGSIEYAGDGLYRIFGALVFTSVPELLRASRGLYGRNAPRTLDLAGVSRADSAGLALLIEWSRVGPRGDARPRFVGVPAQLMKMARVSGLERVLELSPDDGDAAAGQSS